MLTPFAGAADARTFLLCDLHFRRQHLAGFQLEDDRYLVANLERFRLGALGQNEHFAVVESDGITLWIDLFDGAGVRCGECRGSRDKESTSRS